MKHAKFFSIIVFMVILAYGAVGLYFLPMASFQGDLTRTGMLPETEFGWRKHQPQLEQQFFTQASMQEAEVLVIGDSFSDSRVWQTILVRHGFKVRTETWDSMRGICADFAPWLKGQGFKGKFVVVEIIERNIPDLDKSVACQKMQPHTSISSDKSRHPPASAFNPDLKSWEGRLSIGIQTALNFEKYKQLSSATAFNSAALPNGTRVVRVRDGCNLFSHRRCNDALFLAQDKAEDIDANILESIATLNARFEGVTSIWAFVPNKSTVYLYPNKQFWSSAERRFNAPNLLRMTQQAILDHVVDLYPANNTHFSTAGYLLMGEEILKAMQRAEQTGARKNNQQ